MKGYLSIRETSYKWGISERRVNHMWHRDASPVQSVSGVHGQSLMMP